MPYVGPVTSLQTEEEKRRRSILTALFGRSAALTAGEQLLLHLLLSEEERKTAEAVQRSGEEKRPPPLHSVETPPSTAGYDPSVLVPIEAESAGSCLYEAIAYHVFPHEEHKGGEVAGWKRVKAALLEQLLQLPSEQRTVVAPSVMLKGVLGELTSDRVDWTNDRVWKRVVERHYGKAEVAVMGLDTERAKYGDELVLSQFALLLAAPYRDFTVRLHKAKWAPLSFPEPSEGANRPSECPILHTGSTTSLYGGHFRPLGRLPSPAGPLTSPRSQQSDAPSPAHSREGEGVESSPTSTSDEDAMQKSVHSPSIPTVAALPESLQPPHAALLPQTGSQLEAEVGGEGDGEFRGDDDTSFMFSVDSMLLWLLSLAGTLNLVFGASIFLTEVDCSIPEPSADVDLSIVAFVNSYCYHTYCDGVVIMSWLYLLTTLLLGAPIAAYQSVYGYLLSRILRQINRQLLQPMRAISAEDQQQMQQSERTLKLHLHEVNRTYLSSTPRPASPVGGPADWSSPSGSNVGLIRDPSLFGVMVADRRDGFNDVSSDATYIAIDTDEGQHTSDSDAVAEVECLRGFVPVWRVLYQRYTALCARREEMTQNAPLMEKLSLQWLLADTRRLLLDSFEASNRFLGNYRDCIEAVVAPYQPNDTVTLSWHAAWNIVWRGNQHGQPLPLLTSEGIFGVCCHFISTCCVPWRFGSHCVGRLLKSFSHCCSLWLVSQPYPLGSIRFDAVGWYRWTLRLHSWLVGYAVLGIVCAIMLIYPLPFGPNGLFDCDLSVNPDVLMAVAQAEVGNSSDADSLSPIVCVYPTAQLTTAVGLAYFLFLLSFVLVMLVKYATVPSNRSFLLTAMSQQYPDTMMPWKDAVSRQTLPAPRTAAARRGGVQRPSTATVSEQHTQLNLDMRMQRGHREAGQLSIHWRRQPRASCFPPPRADVESSRETVSLKARPSARKRQRPPSSL